MPFRSGSLAVAVALAGAVGVPYVTANPDDPAPKPVAPKYAPEIVPLLKTYCFECHNPSKRRGGLDLESIDESAAVEMTAMWKDVGERLHAKDMPPAKSKQPTDAERARLRAWVGHVATSQVDYSTFTKDQLTRALALPATNRRLNRDEYNHTIRDLFGFDFRVGDLLPSEGGGGEGFDNAGATLFITPVLIEKYLDAAELVLGTLLPADDAKREALKPELVAARKRLLVAAPGPGRTPHDAARAVLETFVPRAFRRPATAEEIAKPLALFDAATTKSEPYERALKLALKRVLISPHFLFLIETPAATTGVGTLGPYELASHLSYFLWASMPDETLIALAAQDKLKDETVLREQVRRMLRDPRSRGFTDGFGSQWLGIRPLGQTVRPDAKAFPEFDAELAAAMREETVLFFDAIVKEDRSLLDVIHADFTFVNERLAKHYGIPDVKGPEMRRVTLKDPARGGVLGHASILTVTSFPHRTSPVLRGRWILEELLGSDVPPPPPDAPVLNERQKTETNLTFRQMLEKHRAKAECATCHNRMDPLGFGLENFDPIGRWRVDLAGKPLDTAGVLPTGEGFNGPAELKRLILDTRKADFLKNVSRKALGYATGREVRTVDLCVVRDGVRALEQNDFRFSQLIEAIVVSVPFSHRLPTP